MGPAWRCSNAFRPPLGLPDALKVDIARTRRESYADPAALPDVVTASLEEDLFRRDFTINAMAIQLNLAHSGELRESV